LSKKDQCSALSFRAGTPVETSQQQSQKHGEHQRALPD
jgi:hypothetical protein